MTSKLPQSFVRENVIPKWKTADTGSALTITKKNQENMNAPINGVAPKCNAFTSILQLNACLDSGSKVNIGEFVIRFRAAGEEPVAGASDIVPSDETPGGLMNFTESDIRDTLKAMIDFLSINEGFVTTD